MSIKSIFKSLTATSTRRRPTRRPASRPYLEPLEDRVTPSFTVGDYSLGSYSKLPLVADFNNDLVQDLALTTGASVSIRLGHGNGTFGAAREFPTGVTGPGGPSSVAAMAAGDLNRDGNVDLLAATYNDNTVGYPKVLLGNGDGTFQSPGSFWLETPPPPPGSWFYSFSTNQVAVADANADGRPDLLFTGEVWYLTDNGEEFYAYGYTAACLGNEQGWFTQSFGILETTGVFTPADLNGDGKVDMVGAGGVRLGRGDGTFNAWQNFSPGPAGDNVAVGDFNGDGKLDVAATNSPASGNGVFIRLGNGDGTVQPALSYTSPTRSVYLTTADFNGDGRTDLATANEGSPNYPNPEIVTAVTVRLGNGNGTFQTPVSFLASPAGVALTGMTRADFNGDGRADLAVSTPSNLRVLLNDGIWTSPPPSITISDASKSEGRKGKTTLFTFTVTLSAAYDQPVTMSYRTMEGTAKAGEDYIAKTGTLTFAPGETTKTITIEVKGDSKKEADETFYLDLFGLSSNALFTKNRGTGTILNDD